MNESQVKQIRDNIKRLAQEFSHRDLDNIMLQNPSITSAGITSLKHESYTEWRAQLQQAFPEFQLACAFLSLCKRTKSVNHKNALSYWQKHKLERFMGTYIPNGAIIAAAACLGLKYEVDGANVWLAIHKNLPITDEMLSLVGVDKLEENKW
ncbi:MAG: hypothetical protein HYV28_06940 [Ignavibacteriales bacterium]|nr:hypothetical protein [Ignavibacteriales bacterium]